MPILTMPILSPQSGETELARRADLIDAQLTPVLPACTTECVSPSSLLGTGFITKEPQPSVPFQGEGLTADRKSQSVGANDVAVGRR